MAFRCRPVFMWLLVSTFNLHFFSCFWKINSKVSYYELSNYNVGGSLVCVIPLCGFLNLPITADCAKTNDQLLITF